MVNVQKSCVRHGWKLLLLATLVFVSPKFIAAQDVISFNRDIRPILSDNCFFCHGPDNNKREADLRLDTLEGLQGKDGKPGAIVPGKPQESLLISRILTQDPQEHMPPASSGKKLNEQQIELLKRWVAQGGQYEGHWAFLPRKVPPAAEGASSDLQVQKRIDSLIDSDCAKQGLTLSPQADRITLLRRL